MPICISLTVYALHIYLFKVTGCSISARVIELEEKEMQEISWRYKQELGRNYI